MKKFKILFITPWYPSQNDTIRGVFVREHAKAVKLYDDIVVFHYGNPDPNLKRPWKIEKKIDYTVSGEIPTYRLIYKHYSFKIFSYFLKVISLFQALRLIISKGYRPDIIHAHIYSAGFHAVLLGKIYSIPVVITEQSSAIPRRLLKSKEIFLAKLAYRRAKIVLPVSRALQKSIENLRVNVKFDIVPNVTDLKIFYPQPLLRKDSNIKKLLFVGLLVPVKGLKYLISALSILQQHRDDWHLDIVGDGPGKKKYIEIVNEFNLTEKIKFHGIKTKLEIAELMRQASLFVLTSTWDSMPCVLIEAMASGLPIVATAVGGIPEIVEEDCGYLAESMNPVDIFKKLDKALSNLSKFNRQMISKKANSRYGYINIGFQLHRIYMLNS